MKYIIGIALAGLIAFILYKKYYCTQSKTSTSTTIPNTLQGFYTAVSAGQIKIVPSDPMGIYAADATTKIGYWTADGSVYDIKGNMIAKGMGGLSNYNKLTF